MAATDLIGLILRSADRESRLRTAFAARGADLVSTYRRGPYGIEVLYRIPFGWGMGHYWTIQAWVDKSSPWTQDALDDDLHRQLIRELDKRAHSSDGADWARSG